MATSTGKTFGLILLIALIALIGFRLTPLVLAPLGIFPGAFHWIRTSGFEGAGSFLNGFFHFAPFSLIPWFLMILWIVVIVWVYRDAERRGMNGVLWSLLVFIGNLIGLLIYLIVRSDNLPIIQAVRNTEPCPDCNRQVDSHFVYCPHCGKRLQAVCPGCEKPVENSWSVCPYCGEKLDHSSEE